MKAAAARLETDGSDLRELASVLGVTTLGQAMAIVNTFYGPGRLTVKTQLVLEDILGEDELLTD